MKRTHRKATRKTRRHHKRHMGFLEALRLYIGFPVLA